jgi:MoxR-like ATPase
MDEIINYLKEKSLFFESIVNDTYKLFEEVNKLKNTPQLEYLIDYYKDANGPINILRLIVLKALKLNENITDEFINEIKENILHKNIAFLSKYIDDNIISYIENYADNKDFYRSWTKNFGIFFPFFYYGDCKDKVNQYLIKIGESILKELNLTDYKMSKTGFDGPRNQGQSNIYVNTFPSILKNYNNSITLFFEVKEGKLLAGASKSEQKSNSIEIPKKYLSKEFSNYQDALNILKEAKEFVLQANNELINQNCVDTFISDKYDYANPKNSIRYWTLSAGEKASMWDDFQRNSIIALGWDYENLGDLLNYANKKDINQKLLEYKPNSSNKNDTLALWQFANEIKSGDVVYIKNKRTEILGRGIIKSQYIYDEDRSKYKHTRQVEWTNIGEWESEVKWAVKTLTNITPYTEDVEKLENLFNIEIEEQTETFDKYTEEDFLNDVFIDRSQYETLKNLLLNKKNIILQGAPGVGKTYTAKRLAYSILGEKDTNKVKMIQFHQSYGYEDFIMGYRPKENGFELVNGPFYKFCKKAEEDSENNYFFIIDEINRGKLSKIFGELLMLIEPDKRGQSLRLLYKDEEFSVPKNLYIIGMMNTADRSIALIDYALRRRFAFYDFKPAFETESFISYKNKFNNPKYASLINEIIKLNKEIANDCSLGSGFQIGHSYFCNNKEINDEWLNSVVAYEILPLLKEYWFDEQSKIDTWTNNLKSAIK